MHHREEKISEEFTKHVLDFPHGEGFFHTVVHHFTGPDKGDPHDHPFSFTSHILKGGYIENVYHINDNGTWYVTVHHRAPGTAHYVDAKCIHEIIELPEGECWTMAVLGKYERDWRHWQFRRDGVKSRAWFEEEYK